MHIAFFHGVNRQLCYFKSTRIGGQQNTDLFNRLKDIIQNLIVLMKKATQTLCHPHFKSTGLHVSAVDQSIHPGWQ